MWSFSSSPDPTGCPAGMVIPRMRGPKQVCKPIAWLENPVIKTNTTTMMKWFVFNEASTGLNCNSHKIAGRRTKTMKVTKTKTEPSIDITSWLSSSSWFIRPKMVDMVKENKPLTTDEHIATLPISDFMILSSTRRLAIVGSATSDSACPTVGRLLISSGFMLTKCDGSVCTPMRKKYRINPIEESMSSGMKPLRGKKLVVNDALWPRTDGPSSRPPWPCTNKNQGE